MANINVEEILSRYTAGFNNEFKNYKEKYPVRYKFFKVAIKEIVEAVIDKCVEEVQITVNKANIHRSRDESSYTEKELSWSEYDSNGPDYYYNAKIDDESILQVKQMITY